MRTSLIALVIALLLPAGAAYAAIAVDISTGVTGTNPIKNSVTRGTGASNYVGIVLLEPFTAAGSASQCTWGGTAMTQVWDQVDTTSGAGHGYAYRIINPTATASIGVTCSTTANYGMEIVAYSGVDQTTPIEPNWGGAGINFVNNSASVPAGGAIAATGTVAVTGSWIVQYSDNTAGVMSAVPPAVIRGVTAFQWLDSNSGLATGLQAIYMKTTALSTMTQISMALRPAVAAATASFQPFSQLLWLQND